MSKEKRTLCASMMCANLENIQKEVYNLEQAGIDVFHLDIMDGHYVRNFGLSPQDVEAIRKNTNKMIDVHLMIENPLRYLRIFVEHGVDIIYVHLDIQDDVGLTLREIKKFGIKVGLAINPNQSIDCFSQYLKLIDIILVMTVNPGFAGQTFIDHVVPKIEQIVEMKDHYSFKVFVDGAISADKVKTLSRLGVDGFVLGTSILFNQRKTYREAIMGLL